MSSNPNADAAGRILNNTLIFALDFLLPAKKSFIDVAGFSSAIPFVKYIEAMKAEGITIDAITVQNEPLHPGNNPSLLMEAEQQKEFVKNHLGPVFEENNINTKIIVYDHNADRPDYPITILNDSVAAKYIDGAAFHLYGGEVDAISKVHEAHPDKNLYFTEQWVGAPGDFAKEMNWHTENLIIGATRNWCKTVLEWNLAADENQEPHTDRGGCDRCLGAITIKGDNVIVISGRDKGKTGEVLRVDRERNRVLVQGINMVKRHQRPTQTAPGGINEFEALLHVSNVALIDPKTSKPTRIGFKNLDDGSKVRVAIRSGEVLDQ